MEQRKIDIPKTLGVVEVGGRDTDPEVIGIEEKVRDEIMEQRKLDKLE